LVYIPLFFWSKGFITVADDDWRKIKVHFRRPRDEQGKLKCAVVAHDRLSMAMLA
jgi:hypothetical protein